MKKLILLLSLSVGLTGCDWFSGDDADEYLIKNETDEEISIYITGEDEAIATIADQSCEIIGISKDEKKRIEAKGTFDILKADKTEACTNCTAVNANTSTVNSYKITSIIIQSRSDELNCE